MTESFRFWAVIPAAGSSRRMGAGSIPKQYLSLRGKTVLEWSLAPFLARNDCVGAVVVLAPNDPHWGHLPFARNSRVRTATGGAERALSVLAGLEALPAQASDWILVHDAARPCLSAQELDRLIDALRADEVGGLLAAPVVDTLKRTSAAGHVEQTVERQNLWRALTPQMFRHGTLAQALTAARHRGHAVTDESQAIEALGLRPRVVAGHADNMKITLPEDLARAERILAAMLERAI